MELATTKRALQIPALSDEYLGFVLLNLLDLCLTAFLMTVGHSEANPLGAHVLDRWGFAGFSLFKFGLVLTTVCGLEALFRLRPGAATAVSRFAVVAYVALVIYEAGLLAAWRL